MGKTVTCKVARSGMAPQTSPLAAQNFLATMGLGGMLGSLGGMVGAIPGLGGGVAPAYPMPGMGVQTVGMSGAQPGAAVGAAPTRTLCMRNMVTLDDLKVDEEYADIVDGTCLRPPVRVLCLELEV